MTISPVSGLQSATKIVSPTAGQGNYTTIQAAITAASSGETILIKPSTYVENLTLKAGVNLAAFECDALTPNVTISGKCTFTVAGTVSISGIRLQTNSDFALAVTGSAASVVNLKNCYINATNNTGISFTSSSGSAVINLEYCKGDLGTTGIAYYSMSSAGTLFLRYTVLANSGNSSTASTSSAGVVQMDYSEITGPISNSGSTNNIFSNFTLHNTNATNSIAITVNSTSTGSLLAGSQIVSGTGSGVSIGASAIVGMIQTCNVNSSNASAIAGTGTLNYSPIVFNGSSSTIASGLTLGFYPSINQVIQTFTSSGTYTPTKGMYQCIIECIGGGGGGGGCAGSTAGNANGSGGGGGGGYARKLSTAATIGSSQTVTIGAAGLAGTAGNNPGGNGGDTSVGSICIGKGGTGGAGSPNGTATNGGAGGVAGTGDLTFPGQAGGCGSAFPTVTQYMPTASGGSSYFGAGGAQTAVVANATGPAGSLYGGGGGGAISFNAGGTQAGAAGAKGVVIITEYVLT